ncbi:MAG TPA: glycosyltransferase [Capillimicrobium sp.]|jgi:glycosyltransferase involved in cell wall biosynthesis
MTRVVTLTPASLDRDSRTLKQATTVARLGYASVVVEAQRSAAEVPAAPFEVVTLRSVGESLADGEGAAPDVGRSRVERVAELLGRLLGPLYFLASWAAFNASTARRLPEADLYYLHGYEQALAVWLRRRPYVYDAHDLYAALPHDGRRLSWQERAVHRVREAIERACIRRAAARVTTSGAMARAYEARFGRPFDVVRNAQDARLARPSERDVRSAAGVGEDVFLLAMVAQHKPGTVVPAALPAGVHLAYVGDGYEEAAAGAAAGAHFVGAVPPDEIASFLRSADAAALLYVPVTDNSPTQLVNGLFHAVAAGLPLLVPAGMHAIRETAEQHGLGVVVDPEDPASLAAGVAELRSGLDGYRAAVRAAADELSWAHEEAELAAILARALAR